MSALRHLSPFRARLLLALFAWAMLVRALVPTGWMPVAEAGGFRMVPCSGSGPAVPVGRAPMAHAMSGMHHDKDAGHGNPGADHPCAFAGVTPGIDSPALVVPVPVVADRAVPAPKTMHVGIGHGLAAPPPPQTGPPILA